MGLIRAFTVISLLMGAQAFAEGVDHHQEHQKHQESGKAPSTKPTKKFTADENLKKRMNTVLEAMTSLHKKSSKGLKKEHLVEAGTKIETTVQDIFKTCKLAPDADAAIHPILADLLEGASLLKKGSDKDGHEKIHNALLKYEDFFTHAGWKHSKNE